MLPQMADFIPYSLARVGEEQVSTATASQTCNGCRKVVGMRLAPLLQTLLAAMARVDINGPQTQRWLR